MKLKLPARREPDSTTLPRAYGRGAYLLFGTLAVMMLAPVAFDIYRKFKEWLLYEPHGLPPGS